MMTEQQHAEVRNWIAEQKAKTGKHPTQCQVVLAMLRTGAAITNYDAIPYGLAGTFRSRLSDLRKRGYKICPASNHVGSRYDEETGGRVHAHRLARGGVQ